LLLLSNQCTKDAKLPDLSRLCSTWDGGCKVTSLLCGTDDDALDNDMLQMS
jgi:hypothetical protein